MKPPVMHTVYDTQGNAHTVEPVDAREYVASGSYFSEPPAVDESATNEAAPEKVRNKPGPKPKAVTNGAD